MNTGRGKILKILQKTLKVVSEEYKKVVEICNKHKEIFIALVDRAEQLEALKNVSERVIRKM